MMSAAALDTLKALAPYLTAIFVGSLSLFGVWLGNRLGSSRDVRLKETEANLRRKQRWEDFEGQTLIEFQDAAVEFLHVIASYLTEISLLVIAKDSVKILALVPKISGDFAKTEAVLFNLLCRIQDDRARELATAFMKSGRDVRQEISLMVATSGDDFKHRSVKANSKFDEFQERFLAASGHVGGLILDRINGTA